MSYVMYAGVSSNELKEIYDIFLAFNLMLNLYIQNYSTNNYANYAEFYIFSWLYFLNIVILILNENNFIKY